MPKDKEINHPCHLLSLPSAKRFWCRHCMTVFEDAITRWRHSRSCRYGVVDNFMRRRELEAKALQNTTVLNPVEARLEQSIQMCDLASASNPVEIDPINEHHILPGPESFNCFICHQKFASMEEMRVHVKYPCSNSKLITSCAPHPRHSVPVFIDALPGQTCHWQLASQHSQNMVHPTTTFASAQQPSQQLSSQTSYSIDIQSQQEVESQYEDATVVYDHNGSSTSDGITPTNIYVNEQGETVIEVENLDLNSEGGELSLAHLLTQLSQQGIVFDKSRSSQLHAQHEITVSNETTNTMYTMDANYQQTAITSKVDEEEGQPTAEDAANTLAQLAGFRSFSRTGQVQPDGEAQVPSQVETYSYSSSLSGSSRQYTITSQPQIHMKYEYEYSDSLSAPDTSTVTSQEYENVKVEQTTTEETIQYYSDSSNVTYVTDSNNHHHHIPMDTEAVSNIEDLRHNSEEDQPDSGLIQHYPVEINGSGQLIIAPNVMSAQQLQEAHTEYVMCEGHKAEDVEIHLSSASEESNHITNFNANDSLRNPDNSESSMISQDNQNNAVVDEFTTETHNNAEVDEFTTETQNNAVVEEFTTETQNNAVVEEFTTETQNNAVVEEFTTETPNNADVDGFTTETQNNADDFATEAVSFQEIVDGKNEPLSIDGQTLISKVSGLHYARTELDLQMVTDSIQKQTVQYNDNSLVDLAIVSENTDKLSSNNSGENCNQTGYFDWDPSHRRNYKLLFLKCH